MHPEKQKLKNKLIKQTCVFLIQLGFGIFALSTGELWVGGMLLVLAGIEVQSMEPSILTWWAWSDRRSLRRMSLMDQLERERLLAELVTASVQLVLDSNKRPLHEGKMMAQQREVLRAVQAIQDNGE